MQFRMLLVFLLMGIGIGPAFADDARTLPTPQRTLVILNWSEYMDPELIAKFEKQYNAKVSEVYFEGDDLRDDMMLETEGRGFDLVLISGEALARYRKRDWLAPLDLEQIPNYKHINEHWVKAFPDAAGYGAPYFWGTLGIAYRADLVSKPPTSWMDLLKPEDKLRGKVSMIESTRDLMTVALKAQGYSANSTDKAEIESAKQLLLEQKPFVRSYVYLNLDEDSALVTGEVAMSMAFNGDTLMVQEHDENIQFVLPEEGGNIWVDYLVVTASSPKKDLAYAFINFLNEPEHAAQLAEYVYFASPNKAAEKLLPEEFLTDPVIYPSPAALSKSEFHTPLPPRATKRRNLAISRIMQ